MTRGESAVWLIILGSFGLAWSMFQLGVKHGIKREQQRFRQYVEQRARAERTR